MWIVVQLIKGYLNALSIKTLLENEGIIVMIKKATEGDETTAFYDVLVPQTELEQAQEIIINNNDK